MALEYFGSPDQQAMARRGAALYRLLENDPRFSWYGRNVALADYAAGGTRVLADLVRIQGASVSYLVPRGQIAEAAAALEAEGLKTDWMGFSASADDSSPDRAEALLAAHPLPADLTVTRLGPDSPDADLSDLAEVALEAGVLPPPASVLRGEARRGVALLARDDAGQAVSCAASFEIFHPESRLSGFSWWGMLATRPQRQGEKIALLLGARAMLTMTSESGRRRFITGIRDDNAASVALCAKLGVTASGTVMLMGMDPAAFSDARITK